MEKKKISSEDVAKKAGVSRTTVSFVLNNTPGKNISEETRQKVLKAAQELVYIPNEAARNLAMTRHYTIGLFICHSQSIFSDSYIIKLIDGIGPVLNKNRIQLVLQPFKLSQENYIEIAKRDKLDGVILLNTHENDNGMKELIKNNFPLVVIGTIAMEDICQVDIDNTKAAIDVVDYLIKLKHKNIAMIVHASLSYYAAKARLEGYKIALKKAGIEFDKKMVVEANFTEESGYASMKKILSSDLKPTAVFAGNDVIAYGAIKAIQDEGLRIPDDISIVGFDDDYLSRYLNPTLTTVTLPAAGLGSEAVKILINIIKNKNNTNEKISLPTNFTIRKSCKEIN